MAGYRANNTVMVIAVIVIVLLAMIVLYFVFGGRYVTVPPPPAPIVPETETRVELPRVYVTPPEQPPKQEVEQR
ncbi:hypothetical protein [Legionella londiniensis]|uniref:Uncharacterized protein n=1 Tax=Legionella londiniensis TaxID=45068 RepID=A0A0W0VNV7_9GAMM|nr:hypothetical protein [Legionella londiniensis]KTD21856.1 hypothetical protein Llon_1021 [Legionella londiniensis]STX92661.1 Uncharacterised protein [Legionella londiniensis]